jgi:hypothetical protein
MGPGLSLEYPVDQRVSHLEARRKPTDIIRTWLSWSTSHIQAANKSNIIIGEFRQGVLGAVQNMVAATSFGRHILAVVFGCSREKVIGVATRRIVAVMANLHPAWNGSIRKLKSNSVGVPKRGVDPNSTVSMGRSAIGPFPAFGLVASVKPFPKVVWVERRAPLLHCHTWNIRSSRLAISGLGLNHGG